jgi:hypothetical protein
LGWPAGFPGHFVYGFAGANGTPQGLYSGARLHVHGTANVGVVQSGDEMATTLPRHFVLPPENVPVR